MGLAATKVNEVKGALALSQEEVGRIVGATGRSVSRWTADETEPQKLTRQRLMELAYVAELVSEVISQPTDAHAWLMSPNRCLAHDPPAERIKAGDYRSVLALLEALADGAVL